MIKRGYCQNGTVLLVSFDAVGNVAFDGLLVLFGLGALWYTAASLKTAFALGVLATTDAGSIAESGRVALRGTVRAIPGGSGPFTSPLGQRDGCVLARWKVQEFLGHSYARGSWSTRADGFDAIPFLLDDGTGGVRVEVAGDPPSPSFDLLSGDLAEPILETDTDEPEPDHVRAFVESHEEVPERRPASSVPTPGDADVEGNRRYYEGVLQPGDEVFLAGYATVPDDAPSPPRPTDVVVTTPPEGEGVFVLIDGEKGAVMKDRWWGAMLALAIAAVCLWYGLTGLFPAFPFVDVFGP